MNDQKTVIGQVHVSADNLYSPQAVTGLTVTKRTTGSLTCKWNQATDTYDGYACMSRTATITTRLSRRSW